MNDHDTTATSATAAATAPTTATPKPAERRADPMARHRLDVVALCFGAAFIAIGGARLVDLLGWVHVDAAAWFGTAMVVVGVVAVIAMVVPPLRRRP